MQQLVKSDLDKVREYNIRNRQPVTVVVFKLYSEKTPVEIFKLLGTYKLGNNLPWDLWGIKTRIDYNYDHQLVDSSNCLIFFKVTGGDLPPRVELDNLKIFRKGVDGKKFTEILYKGIFRFDGKFIQTWDLEESREKVKVLKDFINNYVES